MQIILKPQVILRQPQIQHTHTLIEWARSKNHLLQPLKKPNPPNTAASLLIAIAAAATWPEESFAVCVSYYGFCDSLVVSSCDQCQLSSHVRFPPGQNRQPIYIHNHQRKSFRHHTSHHPAVLGHFGRANIFYKRYFQMYIFHFVV